MAITIDRIIRSRNPRRKKISLEVTRDARLIVRAPSRVPEEYILELVEKKADWIARKKEAAQQQMMYAAVSPMEQGLRQEYPLLGREYQIVKGSTVNTVRIAEGAIQIPERFAGQEEHALAAWFKRLAKKYITGRVEVLSQETGISYSSVRIGSARKRWGSCGGDGRLNFTWRLIFNPPEVIDYVIIHELCHVPVRNHSRRFWNKVESFVPDYKMKRKWLKEYGELLEVL